MTKKTTADVIIRGKDQSKQAVSSAKQNIGLLTKVVKSYFAEIMVGVMAAKKLFDIIKDLTKAYGIQEDAIVEMNNALQNTGIYTPQLSKELQTLATELQAVTRYGDEVTISAIGMLQSIGKMDEEMLKRAIPAVQDLASAMFKGDMRTAASMFAKVIGSSTNALTRYGIEIDMSGTKAEKFEEILKAINEGFGGRAQAVADTYTGKVTILKNAFGDLKEEMGRIMADRIEPMLPLMTRVIQGLDNWIGRNKELKDAYDILAEGMEEFNAITKISILEAQNAVDADKIRSLLIKSILLPLFPKKIRAINEEVAALRKGIRARHALMDNMKLAMEMRKKEEEVIKAEVEEIEIVAERIKDEITMSTQLIIQLQNLQILRAEQYRAYKDEINIVEKITEANFLLYGSSEEIEEQSMKTTEAIIDETNALRDLNHAFVETKSSVDIYLEATEAAEKEADEMSGTWSAVWRTMGDTSKDAAEKIKDAVKMVFGEILRMIGKELLVHAFKAMIPLPGLFNPAGAALAIIGSAMAYAGAGFIESLAQGGQFTTAGPQLIQVGDNPSGRERVTVEPLGSSGMSRPPIIVNVYGSIKTETDITEAIYKKGAEQGFWR